MRPFSQEELEFIFGDDERLSIDKLDVRFDLYMKMRHIIQVIYESDALQSWAHEKGDEENSIADLLKSTYDAIKSMN